MPFVPGKTIKGLVREAVEDIRNLRGKNTDDLVDTFGFFDKDPLTAKKGSVFFTNAELAKTEYDAIVSNDASRFMYRDIACTAIDDKGIAKEHSLRKMQVVVPCSVYGEIIKVPDGMADEIR